MDARFAGDAFELCNPRSSNARFDPIIRCSTVCETRTSDAAASTAIRAPMSSVDVSMSAT